LEISYLEFFKNVGRLVIEFSYVKRRATQIEIFDFLRTTTMLTS